MVNRAFILLESPAAVMAGQWSFLPERVRLAYRINLANGEGIQEWARFVYQNEVAYPFVVSLQNVLSVPECILNEIAILFCHASYYRHYNELFLVVEDSNQGEAIRRVRTFVQAQGYDRSTILGCIPVKAGYSVVNTSSEEIGSGGKVSDFATDYGKYLETAFSYHDFFLFANAVDSAGVADVIKQAMIKAGKERQYTMRLASTVAAAEENLSAQKARMSMLENELFSYQELLRLKAESKEMEKVLTFYHNEYEVLPLWFKRVGHIVKVVTGKRKFKSLFNGKK